MPITVLTTKESTARQCNGILCGVQAKMFDSIDDTKSVVYQTVSQFKAACLAKNGDPIVIVHGLTAVAGATNTMKIVYA